MRTLIQTLIIVNLALSASAQLSRDSDPLWTIKRGGTWLAELTYEVTGADTTYTLSYRDMSLPAIEKRRSITFINGLSDVYAALRVRDGAFKLGDDRIKLSPKKVMATQYVIIEVQDKGYFSISTKEMERW